MATLNTSIGNFSGADDLKKVSDYLYRLQDQLRYMFDNITPEDNFSTEAYLSYKAEGEKVSKLKISVDGITAEVYDAQGNSKISQMAGQISLKVNTSDLGNSSLTIKPAKIELATSGQLVISSGNFTLDSQGNAKFKGAIQSGSTISGASISAGTITGTNISGATISSSVQMSCGDNFQITASASGNAYDVTLGAFAFSYDQHYAQDCFYAYSGGFTVTRAGTIYCREVYPSGDWWNGWSLTEVCEELWNAVFY